MGFSLPGEDDENNINSFLFTTENCGYCTEQPNKFATARHCFGQCVANSAAAIRVASFFVCGAARAAANGASCRVRMRGWPCQAAGRVAVQPVPFGSDFFSVVLFVFQCRSTVFCAAFEKK